MESYKFIIWADTHWDKLGAKCVTLDDTDKVEREIFKKAQREGFDFTLFCGDRYLRREPDDETKVTADRVIFDIVHTGNVPHFHLIGNHDWVDKSLSWHTSESLKIFNNVHVLDAAKTWNYKNVRIHALPADFDFDISKYSIDPSALNIFVFHSVVKGSYMNEEGTMVFDSGIPTSCFDITDFDLVFGGDIHIRQKFDLKNTIGGYLGSVVQRTRADSNASRGWTEVLATKVRNSWEFELNFVKTENLFSRISYEITEKIKFEDLQLLKAAFENQLVEVKLSGEKKEVDRLADDIRWKKIERDFGARGVDILRAYKAEQSEVIVDLTEANTILEDLELYLKSDFSSLGKLRSEDIISVVQEIRG